MTDDERLLARLERAEAIIEAARMISEAWGPWLLPTRSNELICELGNALDAYDDAREEA